MSYFLSHPQGSPRAALGPPRIVCPQGTRSRGLRGMFFLPLPLNKQPQGKSQPWGTEEWSLQQRACPPPTPCRFAGRLARTLHCMLPAAHPVTHGPGTPGTPGLVLGPAASGFSIWKLLSRLRSNQPCLLPGPQPAGEGEQRSLVTSALPLCAEAHGP